MSGYLIKHRHRPYMLTTPITPFGPLSRPNSKKYSGNKIEIKIEITYTFSNRVPVWELGRSVLCGLF